jgi:hypothetical protein
MIEHLNVSRAAHFYKRKKHLSNAAIATLFKGLRQDAQNPSKNLFRADRVVLDDARYSAICFSFERSPSFLSGDAGVSERIFGFLLIIEKDELVAVLKSGLDLLSDFKVDYLDKVGGHRVERAIAQRDAIFEKLRLKNMSTSKLALRSKTLEARDLENTVATSSASRFVPQGYSVRRADGSYSATPNTGRISTHADRASYEQVVGWASGIMDLLALEGGETSPFIRNFARPISLSEIPSSVTPTYLAIDVGSLREALYGDVSTARLVREQQDAYAELPKATVDVILEDLDRHFVIANVAERHSILDPDSETSIGSVSVGKTRISLPGFSRPSIAGIFVEDASLVAGTDNDRKLLARYIDRESLFTLLFSDLALAYIDGSLYRDEALLAGGTTFLRHLQVSTRLAQATSEKGRFVARQAEFDQTSVFRIVIDDIAADVDLLLCDDLGDEWADFIGISTATSPAMVSFYHAKHGTRSLGASAFHESVGQAIKNLGRMTLPSESMPAKYASWDTVYRGPKVRTAIPRIVRGGTRNDIERQIEELRTAPDLVKRVFIVTSSLSRAEVETAFQQAAVGRAPSAHFVQLYWLLMSYFSACSEVGAVGYVVCQL